VKAMWLMLQQDEPGDYVIATGKTHTVRDFLDVAFSHIGIRDWSGFVKQDKKFMRPIEVDTLLGDATYAQQRLGWEPETDFKTLVRKMVDSDIELLKGGK
jgi:GDPmannose 4,6-dehydratase